MFLKLLLQRHALPLFAAAAVLITPSADAEVVFDSTATNAPRVLPGTMEVGDEVILAGQARIITRLRLEYSVTVPIGFVPRARLRIYLNDGEPPAGLPPYLRSPRTILFATPEVPIRAGVGVFDVSGVEIEVPDRFTVGFQILGLPSTGVGSGPLFYGLNQLKVGSSFDDYWVRQANGAWTTARFTNGVPPVNFSLLIEAQPDPPIRMLSVGITNARPALRLSGPITSNVVVESAPGPLGPWTAWSTNRFTNGPIRLTDPRGIGEPARFYRARHP